MEEQKVIYETTINAAIAARCVLFLAGFISDTENENISERIQKYRDRWHKIRECEKSVDAIVTQNL